MNSVKQNFIYNTAYQILVIIIPLITAPYLSRVVGAKGIGLFSYYYSVATYFSIFILLGLNNYGNRSVAKIRDNKRELSNTFWNIYAMQLFLGLLINMLYFLYAFLYSSNKCLSLIMGFFVVSSTFDVNWFLFGMEKFKESVFRNSLIKVLTTICIFIFVKNQNDILIYSFIMTFGTFLGQIIIWPYVLNEIFFIWPKWKNVKTHIKPNLILFFSVIAISLYKILDKIMLGYMSDASQVGYYELAERFLLIPMALINSLGTVMLPKMSYLKRDKNKENIIYKSIIFVMFLSTSICFGIMGISKEFIPIFFGQGFQTTTKVLTILMPSCIFLAFANVIRTQYLLPNNIDRPYVFSSFLGAFVNVIINLILIPTLGALGTAIGTLVAEFIVATYQAKTANKYLNINKYLSISVPFLTAGVIMYVTLTQMSLINGIFLRLIFKILIGVVIYFLVLIIFSISGYKDFKIKNNL